MSGLKVLLPVPWVTFSAHGPKDGVLVVGVGGDIGEGHGPGGSLAAGGAEEEGHGLSREQVLSGLKVVALVPWVIPASTAQSTAS